MGEIDKEKINAYIVALYIFQFGFLQPIAIIVDSQWPVAVFTAVLVFIMLLYNGFKIKFYVLISFAVLSTYFMLNEYFYMAKSMTLKSLFLEFILKSFSAVVVGSVDVEEQELYNAFLVMACVNFAVLVFFPFVGLVDSIGYMRYGYAVTPSIIMFFYASFEQKYKYIWIGTAIISTALAILYGSRGPVVVLILTGLLIVTFNKKISKNRKIACAAFSSLLIFFASKYNLLLYLFRYIYNKIGIRTYAVVKFVMMIEDGLAESSSGRNVLYSAIWKFIKKHPYSGNGVGFSQLELGITTHNIFLQILLESGIIGFVIWTCILGYFAIKYIKIAKKSRGYFLKIITLVISVSMGRLLVSSDMWLRPELWLGISLLINQKNSKQG